MNIMIVPGKKGKLVSCSRVQCGGASPTRVILSATIAAYAGFMLRCPFCDRREKPYFEMHKIFDRNT